MTLSDYGEFSCDLTYFETGNEGRWKEYGVAFLQRCDNHKILDVSYYDEKHVSVLLVEDTEDEVPVLVQLPLNLIPEDSYASFPGTAGVNMTDTIPVVTVGPLLDSQSYRRLNNMRAHCFAVSGIRHTATVLFSSRRRVRIFLMDAEEEEDDDDEDEEIDGADVSNQTEADISSQSACSMQTDSLMEVNESQCQGQDEGQGQSQEGQEDKENTSIVSQSNEDTPSTSNT